MTDTSTKIGRPNLSGGFNSQSPIITFRLQPHLYEQVMAYAAQQGVHRNQVLRAAIDAYMHGQVAAPQELAEYAIVTKAKAARKAALAEKDTEAAPPEGAS